jgi:cell division protein FtsI (penicillin-binding protein 3)
VIDDVENIKDPIAGKNLELSIDQRIQYLAYKELQLAVNANKAKSAVLVVLDAKSGEILAAVNQPTFNPNTRKNLKESLYRNRAMTDVFEPGSTIKPFVVAAGLDGGYIKPNQIFETHGVYAVGSHTVKDVHNYGTLDLTGVLKKSSNVGVTQIALKMPPQYFWEIYKNLGFGTSAGSGFPGEANGSLSDYHQWKDFDRAVLSFGYGLSASALQVARAYTALADDGILHSVSLFKRDEDTGAQRVFTAKTAKSVRAMMETVITKEGTAYEARVDGYTVAGKTGTVKKASAGGYSSNSYFAVFAGMAPAKDPRLIIVVMIDEPSAGQYYGGLVSAPVFSKVMSGALRILGVAPDQKETMPVLLTRQDS